MPHNFEKATIVAPAFLMLAVCAFAPVRDKLPMERTWAPIDRVRPQPKPAQDPRDILAEEAYKQGVPEQFVLAVAEQESRFNPRAIGKAGELGLLQLKCPTAKWLGFSGKCSDLLDPQINAQWGILHLRLALDRAGGSLCGAATLHNRGLSAKPTVSKYCRQVLARL